MKVIVFDLDGVVFEKSSFSRQLETHYGISPETTAAFFKGPFVRCQLGQADLKSELHALLPEWRWTDTIDAFLQFWFSCDQRTMPGVLPLVQQLRADGYRCVLATNQEKYRADFLQRQCRLEALFDETFCSYKMGNRKPERSYFETIESALNVRPEALLFWDDTPANVTAAQLRGWSAYQFTDVPALIATLFEEIGCPVKEPVIVGAREVAHLG